MEKQSVILEIEGQKIFGVLHLPTLKKGEKAPAVMIYHGLAGNKIGRYRSYLLLANALANAGIAAFRIDFRGCGDSDGLFQETNFASFLNDAKLALNFLRNHPSIDAEKIAIFGRSFGAAIAVLTAAKENHVKSIALWAALFETTPWKDKWLLCMDPNTPQEIKERIMTVEGQLAGKEFFKDFFEIDLRPHLGQLDHIPLLHIHGNKDDIIDVKQADSYKDMRNKAPAKSQFIRLAEGDHHFSNRQDQQRAIEETVDWYKKTLC